MRVKLEDNLIAKYQKCPEFNYSSRAAFGFDNELLAVKRCHGWLEYFKLKQFLKSIEGRVIELNFISGDAFEKEDNSVWLPASLWEPCKC